MTTIYRVQDREGRGPYRPGVSSKWLDEDNEGATQPPGQTLLTTETLLAMKRLRACGAKSFGFGFRTMDQLYRWFSHSELRRLLLMGYKVVEMDADGVIAETPEQLLFWRKQELKEGFSVVPVCSTTAGKL